MIRQANLKALQCRCRSSKDMLPVPKANQDVINYLQNLYPRYIVHIEAKYEDTARLEHSYWCNELDWHLNKYLYYVDETEHTVYLIFKLEKN